MAGGKLGQPGWAFDRCAVIVAHPDDETLWAGGTILLHRECNWMVVALCRKSDPDRAPKFAAAMRALNASGAMADLDDGPQQSPLDARCVQQTVLDTLPSDRYDLIVTHSPWGEYTRHLRHEEVGKAVLALREAGRLSAREVRLFAYEDGGGEHLPRPVRDADVHVRLPNEVWQEKYRIINEIYGFAAESFEAGTTPREEAFWFFRKLLVLRSLLRRVPKAKDSL
ncbi:MAG TPA: PIG-L family deacetylase [Sedimentisphaerales bacterium]|nr:PIG-L family deacetylase [Sedimentisphaerales bacterium]